MLTPEDWLKTYYPKPASSTTKEEAIQHSLTKWKGLRPAVLEEHGLRQSSQQLRTSRVPDSVFVIDIASTTCSLCYHYYKFDAKQLSICASCPLAKARAGVPCDKLTGEELFSPWYTWVRTGNPEPMIQVLEAALALEQAQ